MVLVAIALGFKSELLGQGQVWALSLGMVVVAAPAILGYLRGMEEFPRIEHYIPVALGAITLAGLSLLVPELWKYLALTAMFGAGFVLAARLIIVSLHFKAILQLLWIFTITFLASYRSFRINGSAIAPRRAFIFSLFVAQVVTFLAWAITALSIYLVVNEGIFAVMLLLAWYINRGLVRHTVEDSFSRNVVLEYGAFAVLLAYLFVSSYQPGR